LPTIFREKCGRGNPFGGEFKIEFIPCLELNTLSTDWISTFWPIHRPRSPELQKWLEEIYQKKAEQARKRLEKLNELGFFFTEQDLNAFSEGRLPTGMSFLKAILSHPENRRDPRLRRTSMETGPDRPT